MTQQYISNDHDRPILDVRSDAPEPSSSRFAEWVETWPHERLVEHVKTLTAANNKKEQELILDNELISEQQALIDELRRLVLTLTHDEVPAVSVARSNEAMQAYKALRDWAKSDRSAPVKE